MPQSLIQIIVLILGIWMPAAFGQIPSQSTRPHQVRLAEPDTSGAVLVQSIDGRFSVRMPSRPEPSVVYEGGSTEPLLRTFKVNTTMPGGISLSASRVVYRNGIYSAGHYFGRLWAQDFRAWKQNYFGRAWRIEPPTTANQFLRRTINGNPTVDFLMKCPAHVSYVRAVLNNPDVVLLVVDFPPSEQEAAERLAKPFFNSLTLNTK